MVTLRKLALYTLLSTAAFGSAACTKKDANVEADYNAKKAQAETLVTQINTSMATMKTDHQQWLATLDQASKKPAADTAKINTFKQDMQKHDADGQVVMALVDSVKMYSNATADQGDAFKNADDRLGTNFNDLNDKWKSYQDTHAKLQTDIQQFAVNTAGNAVQDSAKANAAKTTTTGGTTTTKGGTTTTTTTTTSGGAHTTVKHSTGGATKSTSTTTTPTTPAPADNGTAHDT